MKKHLLTKWKIKTKLIVTFFAVAIVPIIIVGSFSYSVAKNTVNKEVRTFSQQLLSQVNANISSLLLEYANKSTSALTNPTLASLLNSSILNSDEFETATREKEATKILSSIANSDPNIASFFILKADGKYVGNIQDAYQNYFLKEFNNSKIYNQVMSNGTQVYWATGINDNYSKIFLIREYKDMLTGKSYGLLIMSINSNSFDKIFGKMQLDKASSFQILDSSKHILFNSGNNKNIISEVINNEVFKKQTGNFEKNSNLISFDTCNSNWKIIYGIPVGVLLGDINMSGLLTLILVLICGIIAVGIGLRTALNISKPIESIIKTMKKAEQGDLTAIINYNRKDEFGNLSSSFNKMLENIQRLITNTGQVSERISTNADNITISSNQSALAINEIAKAVEEIAKGAGEQASESSLTIKTIKEPSQRIDSVTEGMERIVNTSEQTKKIGSSSIIVINELNQRTIRSLSVASEINKEIHLLNDNSKEIEKIIKVIRSISAQTNLLALNASIEAARAGVAGKGFAVVADEIRKLAEMSNNSTDMIYKIVSTIQERTESTVNLVENANNIFKEQEISVKDTANTFEEIIRHTEDISLQTENIKIMMSEMNNEKERAVGAVEKISIIAEDSSASTQQVMAAIEEESASSEELAIMSKQLYEAVQLLNNSLGMFKIVK